MDGIIWADVFKIIFAGFSTTTLSGAIIFGLSNWLGKIWATRILEKEKLEHDKEIEKYRQELDRARNDYRLYSSKKFEIIQETWNAMFEIVQELTIFNNQKGDYIDYLEKSLNIISKYITTVRKNSLYFDDEISDLLSRYISLCSKVVASASEKTHSIHSVEDMRRMFPDIANDVYKDATERERLMDEIRVRFKKELGEDHFRQ